MSEIASIPSLPRVPYEFRDLSEITSYLNDLTNAANDQIAGLYGQFNGQIETPNIRSNLVTVTDTGSADAEFAIAHNLGVATIYYLPQLQAKPAGLGTTPLIFYKGTTTWTDKIAYLKCTVANCNVKFLVIA